jgi:signal transduction histidine kinase
MPDAAEVSRLMQQVSHELRTPLTTILLEVDVLEGLDPSPAARRSLASVRRAARRLNEVADQVCRLIEGSPSEHPGTCRTLAREE